jgi:CRISPR-associated endonuclease/helicase Cas3
VSFEDFVAAATGGQVQPYPYQTSLAQSGLPDVLRSPTGSDKTLAAVLPWLYRRTAHPDLSVRAATPHGGAKGIRTPDLLDANESRYQLRHSP